MFKRFWITAVALFFLYSFPSTSNAADYAVCVGVNTYSGLPSGSNLQGCVPDARLMERKFRQLGFKQVVVLTDKQATKAGIMSAISTFSTKLVRSDRFVFFFAGHGTRGTDGESVLLPSDASDSTEANDIQVGELYAAVKNLRCDAKTIVLDSCHSGGMVRSMAGLRGNGMLRPRFYVRTSAKNAPGKRSSGTRDVKEWQESDANNVEDVTDGSAGVTYWTAALKTQTAGERLFGSEHHGVFTYHFDKTLTHADTIWRDVATSVTADVMEATDSEQKPVLHPAAISNQIVFGRSSSSPQPDPKPFNIASAFALSAPDQSKLRLVRYPETSPIVVGSANHLKITIGVSGFLVVLNKDPKDQLSVVYPRTNAGGEVVAQPVKAGQTIRIPENSSKIIRPTEPGTDYLKAILFFDEETARLFLSPFRGRQTISTKVAFREWEEVDAGSTTGFVTSESVTLIVPAK